MTWAQRAAWLGLGALAFPIGYRLAFHIADRHYLAIKE